MAEREAGRISKALCGGFSERASKLPLLDTLRTRFLMPDDDLVVQIELLKLKQAEQDRIEAGGKSAHTVE